MWIIIFSKLSKQFLPSSAAPVSVWDILQASKLGLDRIAKQKKLEKEMSKGLDTWKNGPRGPDYAKIR